jgi:LysM repeat protein
MKKLQAMPGILVYMVKPGDELWDIARKYHTSVQEIRTINGLKENQEPSPGTPLLVVKKVEGQIK